jgi:two-component system, OmpR family, alkaline phosphatase synthesis response regulator PhoP
MERKHILLVDDHVEHLELITIMLGDEYDVLAYPSAEEALGIAEEFKPDLLVLDVCMHPIDGVQCLQAIRARPGCSTIPAIALTALARDIEKAALLSAGFQDIVTKPIFDQESLRRKLDRLMESPEQTWLMRDRWVA